MNYYVLVEPLVIVTIRAMFVIFSVIGLIILYREYRRNKTYWRLLVGAGASFLEVGIFYVFRMFGLPNDPIITNWLSSAIHISCLILILITTLILVRSYNAGNK